MTFRRFLQLAISVGSVKIATRLMGLAIGIIIARWLGPGGYGTYAFVMSLVVLATIFTNFGLANLVLRDTSAARVDPSRGNPRLLTERASQVSLMLSLVAMMLLFVISLTFDMPKDAVLRQSLYVGACILPVLTLSRIGESALRGADRPLSASTLSELVPSIIMLALAALVVLLPTLSQSPTFILLARLFATLLGLVLLALVFYKILPGTQAQSPDGTPGRRKLMVMAFPFLLIGSANIVLSRSDVVMLGLLVDQHTVGLYNAALQGALLIAAAMHVADTIIAPEFSKLHAARELEKLQTLAITTARFFSGIGFICFCVLAVFGEGLLIFLFGPEFGPSAPALLVLASGQFLSVLFGSPGFLLNMTGFHKTALTLVAVAAGTNIVLNLLLIPPFGLLGAATATSFSLLLWKFLAYYYVRKHLGLACAAFSKGKTLTLGITTP